MTPQKCSHRTGKNYSKKGVKNELLLPFNICIQGEFKRGITQILHLSNTLTLEVGLKEPNRSAAFAWVIEGRKKNYLTRFTEPDFRVPCFPTAQKRTRAAHWVEAPGAIPVCHFVGRGLRHLWHWLSAAACNAVRGAFDDKRQTFLKNQDSFAVKTHRGASPSRRHTTQSLCSVSLLKVPKDERVQRVRLLLVVVARRFSFSLILGDCILPFLRVEVPYRDGKPYGKGRQHLVRVPAV